MEVNTKNNAFHFVITLCHYRIENMTNRLGKQLIKDAINNENLSDEKIKKYLSSKSLNEMDLINKINDELYNDNSKQISIEKIQKICRKEDNNNSRKIGYEKRLRLLNNLSNPKIMEINSKEKRINIILDNARIHHAKIVEKACEILNINLIFLKPYCPDLNPIEDVWRKIKSKIYKSMYENLNKLIEIFEDEFYKIVHLTSFYTKWVNEYLGINIW
ncbi:transposase [Methanosphaera sp. Vir-13MRS]|uniref:transposase n=1 Tax=Candidatus Methanosphaera massiliense TaxID=3017187 RepID=UPI00237FE217|nr:transposase [Candidatus Methanosphaera massiliense]MDE4078744.1 transposase [Candidatus Methanosphaera massiliense]